MTNPPAACEEGRPITIRFDLPPQMRVLGDIQATTEILVMCALAYCVLQFEDFRRFCIETAEADDGAGPEQRARDERIAEMFAQMQDGDLLHWYDALEPRDEDEPPPLIIKREALARALRDPTVLGFLAGVTPKFTDHLARLLVSLLRREMP